MKKLAVCFGLAVSVCGSAHAIIDTGAITSLSPADPGAAFVELVVPFGAASSPPNQVGNNTFQDSNLYAFNEDQNIVLTSDLAVDLLGTTGAAGTIAAGTTVASHYVFFDPAGGVTQVGWVSFDANILGVLTTTASLSATDFLINNDVTYLNPGLRGLESGDIVSVAVATPQRLDVDWYAGTPGDYVRVLTERSSGAVPDGGLTLALLGMSLVGIARLRKRS